MNDTCTYGAGLDGSVVSPLVADAAMPNDTTAIYRPFAG